MILHILICFQVIVICASIFYSIISQNIVGILYAIGAIVEIILNTSLKSLISTFFPNFTLFLRPNPPKTGCGYFTDCTKVLKTYGMPSGHSQSAAVFAVFWTLYILNNYPTTIYTYFSIIGIIITSIMVLYSRIYIGCHNTAQVFVGSIIGLIYGIFLYKIVKMLTKNEEEDKISNTQLVQIGGGVIIISLIIYNILL
jgi:membrane-associated phospholipid phosphatase